VGQAAQTRVVLVDDDELFLESARAILSANEQIEVVGCARDGAESVRLVERLRPDLVLMDIGLPSIDGVEATRLIHERTPEMPIVMLTGHRGREQADAAADAGAIGYVHKDELGAPHLADSLLALLELS
jgi:DNA-binding NarL/FixJ family response regulator